METEEKRAMGFRMTDWDKKLLKYGHMFESQMMDLSVNIPLEQALDRGWDILAECYRPEETGLRTELLKEFWPDDSKLVESEVEAMEKANKIAFVRDFFKAIYCF